MKFIHTSDWHLGRTFHSNDLSEAHREFLGWLLDLAVSEGVDAVLVAGDVYDRAVPSADSMKLLEEAYLMFAKARIPLVISSGNHDSATRLGFAGRFPEAFGIHLRTAVADIDRPAVLTDEHGEVGVYGIPYLLPDAVMHELGAERSHASVLAAATDRIRADARARGLSRTVVLSHAFISGAASCDSERDIRVGGISDAPSSVFDGIDYVALGHLHGRQEVRLDGSTTTLSYSGSPIAFSFSERQHRKSVTLVAMAHDGAVSLTPVETPVWRPLKEVRGRLAELLADAEKGGDPDLAGTWLRVVLTNPGRVLSAYEHLRAHWPHVVELVFEPEGDLVDADEDLAALSQKTDPVEICESFVQYVGGAPPEDAERAVLRDAVERANRPTEVAA